MTLGKSKIEEKIEDLEQKINIEWEVLKDNDDSKKARKAVKSIDRMKDQQAELRIIHFFLSCGKIEGNDIKTLKKSYELLCTEDNDENEWEDTSIWGKMQKRKNKSS